MANNTYLWIIPYSQHCFSWNFVFYSRKTYLAHQYKKDAVPPMVISNYPIPLKRICVLSYLCLLLTKVLFKSFQYNIKGRRLSNYSIKLILCSHYCSRYKGLCQNKKHGVYQNTKGGHFCAEYMALKGMYVKAEEQDEPVGSLSFPAFNDKYYATYPVLLLRNLQPEVVQVPPSSSVGLWAPVSPWRRCTVRLDPWTVLVWSAWIWSGRDALPRLHHLQ